MILKRSGYIIMLGIPPFFKEIFKHLPNALLDLISWREMLLEVTVLSNRLLTNNGVAEAKVEALERVGIDIELVEELSGNNLDVRSVEVILKLYFCQIMKGQKIFLDFRPKHFSQGALKLEWSPGSLWAEMDQGLRELAIFVKFFCENIYPRPTPKDCIEKMLIAAYHCDRNIPTVNDAMTTKVVCFTPEDSLVEVAKLMTTSTPKIYPVVENGKYIGIITRTDVLKALFTKTEHCFGY